MCNLTNVCCNRTHLKSIFKSNPITSCISSRGYWPRCRLFPDISWFFSFPRYILILFFSQINSDYNQNKLSFSSYKFVHFTNILWICWLNLTVMLILLNLMNFMDLGILYNWTTRWTSSKSAHKTVNRSVDFVLRSRFEGTVTHGMRVSSTL